jgi:hypothetical protein
MLFSQTGLTYFYKWPITCEIQILNLIKCGSGICNRCDQRLSLLASRFFRLAKSLWSRLGHLEMIFHHEVFEIYGNTVCKYYSYTTVQNRIT